METSITRIADLPTDNNSSQSPNIYSTEIPPAAISISKQKQNTYSNNMESATNYIPINVHPNPYGVSAQNPIMDMGQPSNAMHHEQFAQQQPQMMQPNMQPNMRPNIQLSPEQIQQLNQLGHQRLPSRDIVQDTSQYLHDDAVHANYIPKPSQQSDFVREHYELTEKRLQEHEDKKRRESKLDWILTEIQTPILVAILFFLFQLPVINTLIFKRLAFLSLYDADGNFNLLGLILKSSLFGSVYYSLRSMMNFLSEI